MAIALSGSLILSGSITVSGSIISTGTISMSGSIASASYAANADLLDGLNSTVFATTGSNTFIGTQTITGSILQSGSFTSTGTITAQTLIVQTVTSSTVYSSGSNIFGNSLANTQTFTGSVNITGSLSLNNITIPTSASLASTYLPLAGGTLTGALSGTTALFTNSANNFILKILNSGGNPAVINLSITTATSIARNWSIYTNGTNWGDLEFKPSAANGGDPYTTGTVALRITSTGAATFASSVTAGGNIQTDGTANKYIKSTGFISNQTGQLADFGVADSGFFIASTGIMNFVAAGATRFTIGATGAATFTSSVTATSFTGSLSGTASYATNALTASYALVATSASYAATASVASTTFGIGATIQTYGSVASSVTGSNNIFTQNTGSFTSAFFKYTAASGSNTRAGEVISVWNSATTSFTDFSTVDIGSTNNVTASISIVTGQVQFNIQTNSSGWAIKSIATFM